MAEQLKATTQHFILYGNYSEKEITIIARNLEVFHLIIGIFLGKSQEDSGARLPIYFLNTPGKMERVRPNSDSIAGFYSTDSLGTYSVFKDLEESQYNNEVLYHEYTHHLEHRFFRSAMPGWFIEGLASYYGGTEIKGRRVKVGLPSKIHQDTLGTGWIKMETMLEKSYFELNDRDRHYYHAQSFALVHYFMATPERKKQLDTYLKLYANGTPSLTAIEQATGQTLLSLKNHLESYIHGTIHYQDITLNDSVLTIPVTITKDDPDSSLILPEYLSSKYGQHKDDQEKYYKNAITRTQSCLGRRLCELTLAWAEINLNEKPENATPHIEKLLRLNENDIETLFVSAYQKYRLASEEKDQVKADALLTQVRQLTAQITRLDQDFAPAYALYVEASKSLPDYPNENAIKAGEEAYILSPETLSHNLLLADIYVRTKKPQTAINILTPLANDPHKHSIANLAKKLIETIQKDQKITSISIDGLGENKNN